MIQSNKLVSCPISDSELAGLHQFQRIGRRLASGHDPKARALETIDIRGRLKATLQPFG